MPYSRILSTALAILAAVPAAAWNTAQEHVIVNLADAAATAELCGAVELNVDLAAAALTAWDMDAAEAMSVILPLAQARVEELGALGGPADTCRMAEMLFGAEGVVVSGLVRPLEAFVGS